MTARGVRYVEKAVEALRSTFASGFEAQLRIVETDQGLDPNTLPDPVAIVPARVEHDNRAPLIAVFDEGFDPAEGGQRLEYYTVDCTLAMVVNGSPDMTGGATLLRRYVSAAIQTIFADSTLGGQVAGASIGHGATAGSYGDASASRLVYLIPIQVRVYSP